MVAHTYGNGTLNMPRYYKLLSMNNDLECDNPLETENNIADIKIHQGKQKPVDEYDKMGT